MKKRGFDMQKIFTVMVDLENETPIKRKHKEHLLQGNYKGFTECHIEPDWLLVYSVDSQKKELYFARTGSHADLFKQ